MNINTIIQILLTNNNKLSNKNLLRSPSCDQIPDINTFYKIINIEENSKYYLYDLINNRYTKFYIFNDNNKWYYISFNSATNPSTYIWEPSECDVIILL